MLISISARGENASNLSWLLHKRPDRLQTFDMGYAKAHVFYPVTEPSNYEACLLLETDPEKLNSLFKARDGVFQYVNDRQFLSSSMLCAAIAQVFGSALKGRCPDRPEVVVLPLHLQVRIVNFPCRMDSCYIQKIFEPLGYRIGWVDRPLHAFLPGWGVCPHGDLILEARMLLKDLLAQIYILIPVFDNKHHYWVNENHLDSFKRYSAAWLPSHPEKRFIISRYFSASPALKKLAMDEFGQAEAALADENDGHPLQRQRQDAIINVLRHAGVRSVVDLGCGSGKLLGRLLESKAFAHIVGMDVSGRCVDAAREFVKKHFPLASCEIFISSLTYRDSRIKGYDAAVLSEVIEHFEPERMDMVMKNLLQEMNPGMLIVTTPNRSYNTVYAGLANGQMRHPDHRYEFTEPEFREFCNRHAVLYGYTVRFAGIGVEMENLGQPTLMGIFEKCA